MQILLVSDLHYTLRQLDWVASVAADYDLVVVAGDLLDIASIVEPDAQIAVALEYLARFAAKTTVVACSGNHDLNVRNELDERAAIVARRARGSRCPGRRDARRDRRSLRDGVPVVGRPADPRGRRPSARRRRGTGRRSAVGLGVPRAARCVADELDGQAPLRRRRAQPVDGSASARIVFCGHVHQSPFVDGGSWIDRIGSTWVVNAGRQRGPIPTHIETRHRGRDRSVVVARRGRGAHARRPSSTRAPDRARSERRARARASHAGSRARVDHAEPTFVVGVLVLEVGEVRRHHLQARRPAAAPARA